jgi:hypothetical protein
VLGAYLGERLCGIVHYLFHRSCWTTGDYCYLQESPPFVTYRIQVLSAFPLLFVRICSCSYRLNLGTRLGRVWYVPAADHIGSLALQGLIGVSVGLLNHRRRHADILADLQRALAFGQGPRDAGMPERVRRDAIIRRLAVIIQAGKPAGAFEAFEHAMNGMAVVFDHIARRQLAPAAQMRP